MNMAVSPYEPGYKELEALFVNNVALQSIEAYLGRFNPIRVMKMERMEIRHSAILAWLLNPKETHGLSDHFLKAFLSEALKGSDGRKPNALQISQSDMRDADVRCEWNKIDIFILSPQNRWAFIVENKVHSRQHSGQLARYRKLVMELFRAQDSSSEECISVDISGIFLTLNDEEANDSEYLSLGYGEICRFIQIYLENESYLLSTEVTVFLGHYLQILEELTGMSKKRSEMENLARRLYRDHKKVLDFIIEYGSGSDFVLAARRLFGENPERGTIVKIDGYELKYFGLSKSLVSFLPASWCEELDRTKLTWPGCENWGAGYPLFARVEMRPSEDGAKGHLKLIAEVGPISSHQLRRGIIDAIKKAASEDELKRIQFQAGASEERRLYSRFFKKNSVAVNDIHDTDELERKLEQLISDFGREFAMVTRIIPQFSSLEDIE